MKIQIINDSKQETGFYIKDINNPNDKEGKSSAEITANIKEAKDFGDYDDAVKAAKSINLKHYKVS